MLFWCAIVTPECEPEGPRFKSPKNTSVRRSVSYCCVLRGNCSVLRKRKKEISVRSMYLRVHNLITQNTPSSNQEINEEMLSTGSLSTVANHKKENPRLFLTRRYERKTFQKNFSKEATLGV